MLLFYIRHGDPIYNPDSLTPLGHRQAEAVAKRLALHGIDRIFASTSNRALQTARPTSELTKKPIEELDWCNESHAWQEFSFKYNGQHTWLFAHREFREFLLNPEVLACGKRWYEHPRFAEYPFREGVQRINRELDNWLESLGLTHDREACLYRPNGTPMPNRVALFAHQGFGISFLSSLLDIPYPLYATHFDLSHSSMTVIEFAPLGDAFVPRVLQHANDSHLYREGLPTLYNGTHRF